MLEPSPELVMDYFQDQQLRYTARYFTRPEQ